MKTVLIVLAVLAGLIILPFVALPLLAAGGVAVGIAALFGSAAVVAVPVAIALAVVGLFGVMLRLVFGLVGLVFSAIGAVVGVVFSLILLPFVLLPVLLPVLLIAGLIWLIVRAARGDRAAPSLPSPGSA